MGRLRPGKYKELLRRAASLSNAVFMPNHALGSAMAM